MNKNASEDTLNEILELDKSETTRAGKKSGCLIRLLLIATLIFVGFYGFILFRQKLLNLEAEAILRAAQTATEQSQTQLETFIEATVSTQ